MKNSFCCKQLAVVATVGLLLGLVAPAFADFIPLPIKWSQLPDMDIGQDHLSIHGGGAVPDQVVADDYRSSTPDPIVAVRWWGSYLTSDGNLPPGYTPPGGFAVPFHIGFYTDVPADPTDPLSFSHPGTLVYDTFVDAQEVIFGPAGDPELVLRYDAFLPTPFDQEKYHDPGTTSAILWLRIDRFDRNDWGWHEGLPPFLDDAVSGPHLGPWTPLLKKDDLSADMAFELMINGGISVPEPSVVCCVVLGGGMLLVLNRRRVAM